ncbi:SAM-dependent methyltransferase [Nocardia pseudobrasiliensis]|uniref:O-methyltransferase involved in polyketide biosynthesis n=1 Tax=Nocardia pseudobrasiliensis TaxID=45979 RepID=A0A370HXX9_9NOCA|nr:SAM-dependent methyltransferase [Nocardia pseudobrasiliensis]RDI63368.1 O-methyltransferase involved in polyketide biosynthesis [Nocardia pseudobrasiliensis]
MSSGDRGDPAGPFDRPTSARAYGWMLGGRDVYPVDRDILFYMLGRFPECVDIARQNRQFLYRAVRYLVQEAGIRQFLDMGCGLPTDNNVHEVAQRFEPQARVAYVDIDPIVLAHGRALLAGHGSTTAVITADMRLPEAILDDPGVIRLIDFSEPVAVLFLSVGHHLKDVDKVGLGARHAVRHVIDTVAAPGSHLAFSQVVSDNPRVAEAFSAGIDASGIPWQTRSRAEVDALFDGLEPIEPGLVNLVDWRPDPNQPPLEPVPEPLRPYSGATERRSNVYEYGGILRKP